MGSLSIRSNHADRRCDDDFTLRVITLVVGVAGPNELPQATKGVCSVWEWASFPIRPVPVNTSQETGGVKANNGSESDLVPWKLETKKNVKFE